MYADMFVSIYVSIYIYIVLTRTVKYQVLFELWQHLEMAPTLLPDEDITRDSLGSQATGWGGAL